ncbi:MAG TPA: PQQ-binding-like beta-propeller repeat protein [Planctomycetota bacterium]
MKACLKLLGPLLLAGLAETAPLSEESWPQSKFDALRSGNASDRALPTSLGLIGAVPLKDAVLASPVVHGGRIFVVDASGVVTAIDVRTLEIAWQVPTEGDLPNSHNVAAPAAIGDFVHVATSGGTYYVLRAADGKVERRLRCGEPILSSPVVANNRVYFATLGARVFALEPNGAPCWEWDYLQAEAKFEGDRWSGRDWLSFRGGKSRPSDQFLCSRDLAANPKGHVIVPAGVRLVWLEDLGARPIVRDTFVHEGPIVAFSVAADTSYGQDHSTVFSQWHTLDNEGRVDRLGIWGTDVYRWPDPVPGTTTSAVAKDMMGFSSVSVSGGEVYRTRPQDGYGLCRHRPGQAQPERLSPSAAIAPPVLVKDAVVYGDLAGELQVVPRAKGRDPWSFRTPFGKAISAPAAVCDGRVYFGGEDGYLYVLGPDGKAALPTRDLELWKIRTPLSGTRADPRFDRYTSFGDFANTNADDQGMKAPFAFRWVRRFEGTTKHASTFGGGRMYTHTAEGQIFAVEQETGRLLWRKRFPGVHLSYTSPLYAGGRLLVPQAGLEGSRLRCLKADTGELIWEAPFAGSPGWNRQAPPVVSGDLAVYSFADQTGELKSASWLGGHSGLGGFPKHHRPVVRAYRLDTGRTAWEKDFAELGAGGDESGLTLLDGTVYYSCFFGQPGDPAAPRGVTAALEPSTGRVLWSTTKHSIRGGCTLSGRDGRLYLGGYVPDPETKAAHVWCLDARDGSLIWTSDALKKVTHVPTAGAKFLFAHAQYDHGYLLDKSTGKILTSDVTRGFKCTRFALSEPFLLGSNLDLIDASDPGAPRLASTGPRLDMSECVGATVSNGRIFYTANGSGLQASLAWGEEAERPGARWGPRERR